jgi:hypothetical protein
MQKEPETYCVNTAAKIYDVPPKRLRYWCLVGKIKARKVGRLWYISVKELQRHFLGGEYEQ